jgi:DNA-binding transcriptional MerR regulator
MIYRIPKSDVNPPLLAKIINEYSNNLVASALTFEYKEELETLEAGTYIACFREIKYSDVNSIRKEIKEAIIKYVNERMPENNIWNTLINNLESSKTKIESKELSSTSYVIPRLLNNTLRRIIPKEFLCKKEKPGEEIAICLNVTRLGEYYQTINSIRTEKEKEPLFSFCEFYPELCYDTQENGCSQFFKVLKRMVLRFQQATDDYTQIYLILHSYYSRESDLDLLKIIDYMNSKGLSLEFIKKVRVNYIKKGEYTKLCEIMSIDKNSLKLKYDAHIENIDLNYLRNNQQTQEKVTLRINPTYRSSREFIEKYLCKDFDKHKELNDRNPEKYFKTLKNDLEILRSIIGEKIYLSGVYFSIGNFLKLES